MKKYIILVCLFLFGLLFNGCAGKSLEKKEDIVYKDKDGVTHIEALIDVKLFNQDYSNKELKTEVAKSYRKNIDLLKKSLVIAANKTLAENKTNFVILNPEINHLAGFHLNTFKDIKTYCFNPERDLSKIKLFCKSIPTTSIYSGRGELKILSIDKPDYRIVSIDAKKILEEINKEPIQ